MKEQSGNIKEEIVTGEKEDIMKLGNEIGIDLDITDIIAVKRIGKINQTSVVHGEETVVPRIAVVTHSDSMKTKFMKNVYKLKESKSDYYQIIGVTHDMTQEERNKEVELRKEAKARQENDISGNFLYLVRGLPWDRHIVKLRKDKTGTKEEEAPPKVKTADM